MTDTKANPIAQTIAGMIIILIGLGVFAIRIGHPGDYAMPHSSALYGGLASITLGAILLWPGKPGALGWVILVVSPIPAFPAIYSIVGESEEVISIYANDSQGNPADLRLWIVDRDDGAWVGMPRWKAVDHSLDGAQLQMLRGGATTCIIPALFEDRPTAGAIHAMKVEKYLAARVAGAIGLYPLEASESTVVLRLDPCSE